MYAGAVLVRVWILLFQPVRDFRLERLLKLERAERVPDLMCGTLALTWCWCATRC